MLTRCAAVLGRRTPATRPCVAPLATTCTRLAGTARAKPQSRTPSDDEDALFTRSLAADGAAKSSAAGPPKSTTALAADPYDWGVHQDVRAAPLWMIYEAQREERPIEGLKENTRKKVRDDSTEIRLPQRDALSRAYATGRRKNATARVWVGPGSGEFTVNGKALVDYFPRVGDRQVAMQPLVVAHMCGAVDVLLTVSGGGLSGQSGAIKHGLANAIARYEPYMKPLLNRFQLLKRDPRMVERKKPGQKGARAKFQWVKR